MIRYQLTCTHGHDFEAWFASISVYDDQRRRHLVKCPSCASTDIEKRPMAPAIVKGSTAVSAFRPPPSSDNAATGDQTITSELAVLRKFKQEIVSQTEDVGAQFAEEARRMHFGESPERPIRGAATVDEARALHDDGIPFGILPTVPDDHN
jgi:hypothetical protein